MNSPFISIVVPVYNSAKLVETLHAEISRALQGKLKYELILVNDGSKDDSWLRIRECALKHPEIVGVNLRKNCGQDNAIMAGLNLSTGDAVVIMDDDLQHDPNDIPRLVEQLSKGFDVCYAHFTKKKQSSIKNTGSELNGKMAGLLIDKPKAIYLSPFKVIEKGTVKEILRFAGSYPYIDGIILTITSNITQIDCEHHERAAGKSNYTLSRSIQVFFKMFTGFSVLPLRIATISGIVATLIGAGLGIKYLYDYFIARNYIEGWTTVVMLIILFGGLILITLGIVGEYIGRMYLTLNNKPAYSIAEIVRNQHGD